MSDDVYHLIANDLVVGGASQKRPRRRRLANLATALKQAGKAGFGVAGATIAPDGSVSLNFGEAAPYNKTNKDDWEFLKQ